MISIFSKAQCIYIFECVCGLCVHVFVYERVWERERERGRGREKCFVQSNTLSMDFSLKLMFLLQGSFFSIVLDKRMVPKLNQEYTGGSYFVKYMCIRCRMKLEFILKESKANSFFLPIAIRIHCLLQKYRSSFQLTLNNVTHCLVFRGIQDGGCSA